MQQAVAERTKSTFLIESFTIFGLFNLAVARPLFEILARYAEFFVFKRISRFELIAFTFAISILLPFILVLIRFLILKISPTVSRLFFWVLITIFILALVLPGFNRQNLLASDLMMASLVVVCGITSFGYFRFHWMRSFFLFLAPAALIVPSLFIASPKIWQLMFAKPIEIPDISVRSQTPVIVVVFDEFPLLSLLDENHNIDALRYPNFARLSREWNWYRGASTVAERTTESLSAILTGTYPQGGRMPITIHYPKNLFTLFAKSYDLNVFETVTWMDPGAIAFGKNETELWKSLFSDLSLVYLHIILPRRYASNLQPINQSWGDFASNADTGRSDRRLNSKNPDVHLLKFLNSIQPAKRPGLHFIHAKAPHAPWFLLPSGKNYGSQTYEGMNLVFEKWFDDEAAVQRAYQRHLLQIGYVDQWIGKLINKLQKSGIYDRSVIVITADHGASFLSGKSVRTITKENADELVFVPLFIKAPGQKVGRTLDWNVETIDIFPTIADLAQVEVPWKVDGVTVATSPPPVRTRFVCSEGCKVRHQFNTDFKLKNEFIQRKMRWFGKGERPENLMAPCYTIIGNKTDKIEKAAGMKVRFRNKELFSNVSMESDLIPIFVAGNIRAMHELPKQVKIAISVNGTYQATTLTSSLNAKTHNFDALIPEASLHEGKNDVQIYLLPSCTETPKLIAEE
jgi:hypothetical protein